jgi:O-methyltransferase involved in polyketide biosynthesis
MEKIKFDIRNDIARTLIIPLFFRAKEAGRQDALLVDKTAIDLVERIDFDYSCIKFSKHDLTLAIMRVREFDRKTAEFLAQNPGAVVVHIGCGLDTRFQRLGNRQVEWYDLDLPEVIVLRRQLGLEEKGNYHVISSSVFDFGWMDQVHASAVQPILFIAEGVFLYFHESEVKTLILKLRERFPDSELVCDAMTPILVKINNLHLVLWKIDARLNWGLKNARDLETWAEGIKLLDEYYYFDRPEPRLGSAQLMRFIPFFAKSAGIFYFKLGRQSED